jgi:L-iditol 2-dehydrogenase
VEYPFTVGHECAGVVEKTGSKVTRVKPGDIIAIEPAISCGTCDQCIEGRENTCRNLKFLGCPGQANGSLSEYIVMPEECCFPANEFVDFESLAIVEPLSIGIYAVKQSLVIQEDNIGILGFGPIGMSVMLAARYNQCDNIFVTDKINARLDIAKQEGAKMAINIDKENQVERILAEEPLGLDIVFECCGKQEAIDDAIELLKPGGTIILVGIPSFENWTLSADKIRRKELTLINIRRQNHCVQKAIDLIRTKDIDISRMATHKFSFEQTKEAFDLVHQYKDGVMKAMIHFK